MPASAEPASPFRGYRFPSEIITHAVWLHHRFSLSHRDVEELLAERGIQVSYEAIRRRDPRRGDKWYRPVPTRHCSCNREYVVKRLWDDDELTAEWTLEPRDQSLLAIRQN